ISRNAHEQAGFHMAEEHYFKYNVGQIRLTLSLNRSTSSSSEQIPGEEEVSSDDVVLGLYDGFKKFQTEHPEFGFTLSPSFRKEKSFFDSERFESRSEHFLFQINEIISLLDRFPYLVPHMTDVDTVGDERELYRKEHFNELQGGFRKLQYRGFKIRSHHGETF